MIRAFASSGPLGGAALLVAPAVVVFAMAFDNGGYSLASRNFWAIAVWWAVILGVALRALHPRAIGWPALAVGGLLSALALLTLASAAWDSSAERAVNEFNRVSLYLGVFSLTLLFASRVSRARCCDGLALGICGVVAVSLVSRFAPDLFSDRGLAEALPGAAKRLSFPVGYWNGLAILAALAVPLLLRRSAVGSTVIRAAAVAPLPPIAVAIYLASSRGGYATAVIGAAAFLLLSPERWWPAAAIVAGSAGSAVAVLGIAQQGAFVNQPVSQLASDEWPTALAYLVLGCLTTGGLYGVVVRLLRGRPSPGRTAGLVTSTVVVFILAGAIAVTDPVAQLRAFKQPPAAALTPSDDFVRSHLLSANGSGRWQFWETAFDAFEAKPLLGEGAGSYEAWWAEHGSLAIFVRDAHSLYFEVPAELGVVGFLLLVAAFSLGLGTAVRRLRWLSPAEGRDLAAPTAVFIAFAAAAAIDWMWELTVVSFVAFACLALLVGPLTEWSRRERQVIVRPATMAAGVVAAWFLVCLQAVPYLSELRIRASQHDAARGDNVSALTAAEEARAIQPWAASPWLQIALVREELGDLSAAESAIVTAREKDSSDWRLWLVSARLETKFGDVRAARASLHRARILNPRSPLFHDE